VNDVTRKYYGVDFEVLSKINWFCVSFISFPERDEKITIINDKDELQFFYNNHKDDIFLNYNGRSYDIPIWKSILAGDNFCNVSDQLIAGKRPHQVISWNAKKIMINSYDAILLNKSLKQIEGFLGKRIMESSVPFDIDRPLNEHEVQEIVEYNLYDVESTLDVVDATMGDFEAQIEMMNMFNLEYSHFGKTKAQIFFYRSFNFRHMSAYLPGRLL